MPPSPRRGILLALGFCMSRMGRLSIGVRMERLQLSRRPRLALMPKRKQTHVQQRTRDRAETWESSNAQNQKQVKMASNYIWPLSKSTTPDEMNTSFGPRINTNKWDFHD